MATAKVEKKSKRGTKRKSRTSAPSPSPSSSSSSAASSPSGEDSDSRSEVIDKTKSKTATSKSASRSSKSSKKDQTKSSKRQTSSPGPALSTPDEEEERTAPSQPTPVVDPETAFQDFFLQQSTREFAADLEKLRAAPDFSGAKSVEMIVAALRQGAKTFTTEERKRIGEAVVNGQKPIDA